MIRALLWILMQYKEGLEDKGSRYEYTRQLHTQLTPTASLLLPFLSQKMVFLNYSESRHSLCVSVYLNAQDLRIILALTHAYMPIIWYRTFVCCSRRRCSSSSLSFFIAAACWAISNSRWTRACSAASFRAWISSFLAANSRSLSALSWFYQRVWKGRVFSLLFPLIRFRANQLREVQKIWRQILAVLVT